jgi:hypothetical protein
MTDKIQDRLLKASRYEVRKEAADYIDKLEDELMGCNLVLSDRDTYKQQRDELVAVVEKVAEAHFDLSLHKQHDTLTYLKKVAANALVNIKEEG